MGGGREEKGAEENIRNYSILRKRKHIHEKKKQFYKTKKEKNIQRTGKNALRFTIWKQKMNNK